MKQTYLGKTREEQDLDFTLYFSHFTEKEWNKYKKLCEKLEKTNKDD